MGGEGRERSPSSLIYGFTISGMKRLEGIAEKIPNLVELASVTGHKDLRMLQRYYHPRAEDLAKKLG